MTHQQEESNDEKELKESFPPTEVGLRWTKERTEERKNKIEKGREEYILCGAEGGATATDSP